MASAINGGMGSVVSPMPRLIILASGWLSWWAFRRRAICGWWVRSGTVLGGTEEGYGVDAMQQAEGGLWQEAQRSGKHCMVIMQAWDAGARC